MAVVPAILKLDSRGMPQAWLSWQETVNLYVREMVAWEIGEKVFAIRGGINRLTARPSFVTINSIIAVKGKCTSHTDFSIVPKLNNRELFRRDRHMCMYCGRTQSDGQLTRDHIIPRSMGGFDRWKNVVTACRRCNTAKGGRTPEQANMALLAVPFTPNRAEFLALKNRKILSDQMDFLKKQFNHDRLFDLSISKQ